MRKSVAAGKPIRRRRPVQNHGKNQALLRWLNRYATRSDELGPQWWNDFDAFLRRSRLRLRPIDG